MNREKKLTKVTGNCNFRGEMWYETASRVAVALTLEMLVMRREGTW
jgi:hypothetical protein